jgi:hypothetical protein
MFFLRAPITSNTHTHPSHSQTSRLLTSSLSLGVPVPPHNPVYPRRVDSSVLVFSFSSDPHSYIGFVCNSHFIDSNKQKMFLCRTSNP